MQTAPHKPNPYLPFLLENTRADASEESSRWSDVVLNGVFVSIVSTFPLAAFIALVFRFPVPFGGYMSGPSAMFPALIGVAIYGGLMGGFLLVGMAGGLMGILAPFLIADTARRVWLVRCLSVASSLTLLLLFASLDRVIAPW